MLSKQLTHRTLIRYDELLGHRYVANLTMRMPYSEKPYYIRTNKQGFRSNVDYFQNKNNQDEKRIVFLGDSFTAGDGVANEKRFSDLLCSYFNAESYNFGLSGSGVDQQYLIYKHIATGFDHDVVVISPHISDIIRNLMSSRPAYEPESGEKILVPKPYFTIENDELVLHNSPVPKTKEKVENIDNPERMFQPTEFVRNIFHKYVSKKVKEKMLKIQLSNQYAGYESEDDPRWILMRKLIEGIIELAQDKVIILAPLPYQRISINPQYEERFINIAANYDNVHFVDILEEFRKVKDTEVLYYPKDSHYSEYAHELIAKTISNEIEKLKILKRKKKSVQKPTIKKTSNYILGISAFYHDSASALIKDGHIVAAAQEERLTRKKNDASFPYKAINYCLEEVEIDVADLKTVVFYDHPFLTLERIISSQLSAYPKGKEIWTELFPKWVNTKLHIPEIIRKEIDYDGDIHFVKHHLSHAASAFYPSPFTRAAILTIDGVGEWATASISFGNNTDIKMLKEMYYPNSVGLLYSAFTYYTGFKVNEGEYKLMGLAPYGEPTYVDIIKNKLVKINDDGSIILNMKYFGFEDRMCMINEEFEKLFGGPARKSDIPVDKRIRDLAKSIQVVTEEIILKMAKHAKEITNADYLCLAGGVALNCVANGKLLKEDLFKDIWIQPAAGDAGGALGAALAVYYNFYDNKTIRKEGECKQLGSYWGPAFSDDEIQAYLDSHNFVYKKLNGSERNKILAKYISEGKIVGHFSGRMEFGPRALGARSILGEARDEKAQSILNLKIKFRESFRPFAPSCLEEYVNEYFELDRPSPYMLLVADVKKDRCIKHNIMSESDLIKIVNEKRSDLPAITHVDYSARVQTVNQEYHSTYYDLIKKFKNLTGYGVIINTSFNVNREPIVCTPKDAVSCFMTTDMDVLIMNNYLLLKEEQNIKDVDRFKFIPPEKDKSANKNINKLKREAQQLFDKFLSKIGDDDIKLKPFNDNLSSTWFNISNHDYFNLFEHGRKLDSKDILSRWEILPDEIKKRLLLMIEEIVKMVNKSNLELSDLDEGISDSIYVMF
jgi:carbamoyltransferase